MTPNLPQVSDFRFSYTLRVRWSEVDMQKIVFNGHYLMYFDTAVAEYWRALALPYEETMHMLGGDLFVAKATVEYKASAQYDDRLRVCMKAEGNSSITFKGAIFADGKLLVIGELIYVYANPATQKSMPVPQVLRDLFAAFEAGEPMTRLEIGTWQQLGHHALPLRTEVFVTEQGVPLAMEHDELDAAAIHAVVFNRMDRPIATGRLTGNKIGRMAVKRVLRGSDLGRTVLQALLGMARSREYRTNDGAEDRTVKLHAQVSAQDFYAGQGFVSQGDVFNEAGIAHVAMHKKLT
jgi:YbgC/YbaW family acyl-CoA thioester hydrolase